MPDEHHDPDDAHRTRRHIVRWGADLERARPGSRYGILLVLLLATFVFSASAPIGSWVPLTLVALQGLTLLAALAAAEANRHLLRFSLIVIAVGLAVGVDALITDTSTGRGSASILSFLLVGVAPIAIVMSIWRRRVIDIETVLGAVCIYVLLGMFFAFMFTAIGDFGSVPFFAQQKTATSADYQYFSFVTMTTVGYGDLTAATGFGRALASVEGLLGQVYLVTVVALLVSRLGGRLRREA